MSDSRDHRPDGEWTFDAEVTECFDDMLRRSIPQYDIMRDLVFRIGSSFVQPDTSIIDLGASRGGAIEPFVSKYGAHNHYHLVEISDPMLEVLRDRYGGYQNRGVLEIHDMDLRRDFPVDRASLVMSVLTLQFIPVNYRARIVRNAYEMLHDGGAFILVEKLLASETETNDLLVEAYHEKKHENGYSYDAISEKAQSLEGVLVPLTESWNRHMLEKAGFRHVECFWRYLNFGAYLAVK